MVDFKELYHNTIKDMVPEGVIQKLNLASSCDIEVEALKKCWNLAIETTLTEMELIGNCYWKGVVTDYTKFDESYDVYINKNSILKLKV